MQIWGDSCRIAPFLWKIRYPTIRKRRGRKKEDKGEFIMKKRMLAMILGTMLVLSLAACGGSDDATEADATATEETADTEEATEDTEEAADETAAEDVEFEEGDDGPLWSIDMMTEPVDVADTTWSFTGGCIDGEELTDEEIAASLEQYGGQLDFVFNADGTAKMVQGGGEMDGTYEADSTGYGVYFDNNGSELKYYCAFAQQDDGSVVMIALSDTTGYNGLYFMQ